MGFRSLISHFPAVFLLLLSIGTVFAEQVNCGNCYQINPGMLVGVVIGDVILTVIIILMVYFCAKKKSQLRPIVDDTKVYMNMPNR
ncbi:TYRO protein tyrosine kinase-binding protein [Microcaecilia unicolor]|uniref:TYRO protein tyrosine kinase-binding protein n=1 Tax=Microcaecilia unicolor TaxID=1415580 RepID=A0A6P7YSG3_9AMPH|nr:TYRO protein tyrosine kinase-binding protein-like [Microcaecilia unicolor]